MVVFFESRAKSLLGHKGQKPKAGAPGSSPQMAVAITSKRLRTGFKYLGEKPQAPVVSQ